VPKRRGEVGSDMPMRKMDDRANKNGTELKIESLLQEGPSSL
jgi:hypothetical protein